MRKMLYSLPFQLRRGLLLRLRDQLLRVTLRGQRSEDRFPGRNVAGGEGDLWTPVSTGQSAAANCLDMSISKTRSMDSVEAGQEFDVERLDRGDYRLVRRVTPPNEGAIDSLLACPEKGFFVPIDSESTETL